VAWLAATMGWVIAYGALPPAFAGMIGGASGIGAAFGLFMAGVTAFVGSLFIATHFAAIVTWIKRRRAGI
jgi:hypothetical protein